MTWQAGIPPPVPFDVVAGRVQRRIAQPPKVNPHIAFLGQTRSGKDHAIRWGLLPYFPLARVVNLITKPTGDDETWHGWGNWIAADDFRPTFGRGPDGTPRWVIPLGAGQHEQAMRVLDILNAVGDCITIIGDAARLVEHYQRGGLNCEGQITNMMRDGAANGLHVWPCVNSDKWAASGVRDQCSAQFIGKSGTDAYDLFAKWAGLDRDGPERQALATLPPRRFLYTDRLDGELCAGLTSAPAAGWCSEAWPVTEPGPAAADVERLQAAMRRHRTS